jgi:phosphate transport system substrate-binding protein
MKHFQKLVIMSAALILSSCGGNDKNHDSTADDEALSGSISIDGSSTVYPLTEAVAEEFKATAKDVKVTVGLSGTGGGFKKFGRGEIDINDASRPIKDNESEACKANNIDYTEIKVAYDGLAVVVSTENTWCRDLTVAELKMIWEPEAQGKIKRWNQIRKEWPNEEIHLFGAGVESGTYDYFTEVIVGKSHSSRGDYTASEDDNVLVQGIKSDKNALGFFGLAYYTENKDKLKLVGIDDGKDDNGKGAILPSEETVKNKTYVPLGRPLFIYVNNKAAARKEVQQFVKFYIENTKTLAKDVGYISLNDQEIQEEHTKFDQFIGTVKGQ